LVVEDIAAALVEGMAVVLAVEVVDMRADVEVVADMDTEEGEVVVGIAEDWEEGTVEAVEAIQADTGQEGVMVAAATHGDPHTGVTATAAIIGSVHHLDI
jgi:hypothetical protein